MVGNLTKKNKKCQMPGGQPGVGMGTLGFDSYIMRAWNWPVIHCLWTNQNTRIHWLHIFTGYLKHSQVSHQSIGLSNKIRIMNSCPVHFCLSLNVFEIEKADMFI